MIKDRNGRDLTETGEIKKRWQEYWSGLPFSSPGDLPDSGIEPRSPALQADALPSEPPGKPPGEEWKAITTNSSKNEAPGLKWDQCSTVDVSSAKSKVQCYKKQYCIGT